MADVREDGTVPTLTADAARPSGRLPGRQLPPPIQRFLHTEAAGGIVLLAAAVVAVVWANSPWSAAYESLWTTELGVQLGSFELTEDLRHWVNDLLMAVFFFVVGVEIKQELVEGELRRPRTAAVPVVAALGGMVVPALLFVVVNVGGAGVGAWGVPMATDIAFALGVVALLGSRVPPALKLFLLTLAIADDIGAIVVIALFYSDGIDIGWLLVAVAGIVVVVLLRRAEIIWTPVHLALAAVVWLAVYESGVHATIAGVVLGLLAPTRPLAPNLLAKEWVSDLVVEPSADDVAILQRVARFSISTAERLQHTLHPLTSFVIVPLFALANAGVAISADAFETPGSTAVAVGIVVGLVVGKVVGISGATWLVVRTGLGQLPAGVRTRHIVGASAVAGIGFTVSLFIAGLAFDDEPGLEAAAKLGILGASVVAAIVGTLILARARPIPAEP